MEFREEEEEEEELQVLTIKNYRLCFDITKKKWFFGFLKTKHGIMLNF